MNTVQQLKSLLNMSSDEPSAVLRQYFKVSLLRPLSPALCWDNTSRWVYWGHGAQRCAETILQGESTEATEPSAVLRQYFKVSLLRPLSPVLCWDNTSRWVYWGHWAQRCTETILQGESTEAIEPSAVLRQYFKVSLLRPRSPALCWDNTSRWVYWGHWAQRCAETILQGESTEAMEPSAVLRQYFKVSLLRPLSPALCWDNTSRWVYWGHGAQRCAETILQGESTEAIEPSAVLRQYFKVSLLRPLSPVLCWDNTSRWVYWGHWAQCCTETILQGESTEAIEPSAVLRQYFKVSLLRPLSPALYWDNTSRWVYWAMEPSAVLRQYFKVSLLRPLSPALYWDNTSRWVYWGHWAQRCAETILQGESTEAIEPSAVLRQYFKVSLLSHGAQRCAETILQGESTEAIEPSAVLRQYFKVSLLRPRSPALCWDNTSRWVYWGHWAQCCAETILQGESTEATEPSAVLRQYFKVSLLRPLSPVLYWDNTSRWVYWGHGAQCCAETILQGESTEATEPSAVLRQYFKVSLLRPRSPVLCWDNTSRWVYWGHWAQCCAETILQGESTEAMEPSAVLRQYFKVSLLRPLSPVLCWDNTSRWVYWGHGAQRCAETILQGESTEAMEPSAVLRQYFKVSLLRPWSPVLCWDNTSRWVYWGHWAQRCAETILQGESTEAMEPSAVLRQYFKVSPEAMEPSAVLRQYFKVSLLRPLSPALCWDNTSRWVYWGHGAQLCAETILQGESTEARDPSAVLRQYFKVSLLRPLSPALCWDNTSRWVYWGHGAQRCAETILQGESTEATEPSAVLRQYFKVSLLRPRSPVLCWDNTSRWVYWGHGAQRCAETILQGESTEATELSAVLRQYFKVSLLRPLSPALCWDNTSRWVYWGHGAQRCAETILQGESTEAMELSAVLRQYFKVSLLRPRSPALCWDNTQGEPTEAMALQTIS